MPKPKKKRILWDAGYWTKKKPTRAGFYCIRFPKGNSFGFCVGEYDPKAREWYLLGRAVLTFSDLARFSYEHWSSPVKMPPIGSDRPSFKT